MATKVKGDAIKEGSIPLSALKPNRYNLSINEDVNEIKKAISEFKVGFTIIQNSYYSNVYITNISKVGGNSYNIAGISSDTTFKRIIDINNIPDPLFTENDKIDVSVPTPDWNAQEGEAGYIENRPVYFIDLQCSEFYYDSYSYPNYIMWDHHSVLDEHNAIRILDFDDNPKYISMDNQVDGYLDNMDNIFNEPRLYYKWINGYLCLQIPQLILDIGDDIKTYVTILNRCSTAGVVVKMDDIYIPKTVLKITPQKLSDTDKNQALANLGIDPVVMKYLANPFIIKIQTDCYVPEELVGSPVNSADIPVAYEWKYLNPAMYIGYDDMSMQYDTVILSEDTGHMALKVFDKDIYIGKDFKILYE